MPHSFSRCSVLNSKSREGPPFYLFIYFFLASSNAFLLFSPGLLLIETQKSERAKSLWNYPVLSSHKCKSVHLKALWLWGEGVVIRFDEIKWGFTPHILAKSKFLEHLFSHPSSSGSLSSGTLLFNFCQADLFPVLLRLWTFPFVVP